MRAVLLRLTTVAAVIGGALVLTATALAGPDRITVVSSGKVSLPSGTVGAVVNGQRERPNAKRLYPNPLRLDPISAGPSVTPASNAPSAPGAGKAKSNPTLLTDWEGLNHRDSRLAFGGNQFSGEPADQGLCAGNGYVLETVNSALRVYDANGTPVTGTLALNEFYGFPPAINRSTGVFGPFTFDISCHYDPDSNRWFHLAVDLDQDPGSGAFTGKNYLDLAVSDSGDPTGSWTIYRIPGMNDGTEGTPDHGCAGGPCFADFPHIGVDKNGVYITTNEFELFGPDFIGAQVYAMSKKALTSGALSINAYLFNTADDEYLVRPGEPGFTLWPTLSPGHQFAGHKGGTEYFVSSNAVFDDVNADSDELIVWALQNTGSLDSASPSPSLVKTMVKVDRYTVPSNSVQKPGTIPLADCLNDTSGAFFGTNCGAVLFGLPPQNVQLGTIDNGDSRVLDARYANGKLWAVLGTGAQVGSPAVNRTGVGWYILNPSPSGTGIKATVEKQGILALESDSLSYPSLGVTTSGRGVMVFGVMGENSHPSAGYASLDAKVGVGEVGIYEAGKAPQDGFTEYPPIGGNRPRWGDYSAAAVDGDHVYVATQYIEQGPCTLTQFINTGFTCSGKRTIFANWSTRVGKFKP